MMEEEDGDVRVPMEWEVDGGVKVPEEEFKFGWWSNTLLCLRFH
jgi:hypothetical protein